jgi:lincosamide nucleotidyltransferase A/C/D/E
MHFAEVVEVLDALDDAEVRHWVGGGWGIAALVGRQSREHRDLDIAIDANDLELCLRTLNALGYVNETDWLPVRIELRAPGNRWVDVHPVGFEVSGVGHQAGPDGTQFEYPQGAFTTGALNGRLIGCLSLQQQLDFHTGYEHQAKDEHDLALLKAL